jgi:hypothetical protein
MATAIIRDGSVCIVDSSQRIRYTLPLDEFTDLEIAAIKAKRYCCGCKIMPLNGFDDTKHLWCDLSRKIAILEERRR